MEKKRVIIKIGSSSLQIEGSGAMNYHKIEGLVRELCDLKNRGCDVCLVSSGAIAAGRNSIGMKHRPEKMSEKQALAAIGQAKLMMTYQRMFKEYDCVAAQVLMTKNTILDDVSRKNAQNTFEELFNMGVIPVVNANDTISTYEIQFGDNDTLSAMVASLTGADLLILLSDIEGLYTDDPRQNPDARLVRTVLALDENLYMMAKESTGSDVGTGGMATKLQAAKIATLSGADMIIASGRDVGILHDIFEDRYEGTLFMAKKDEDFYIQDYLREMNT
jgi:glutamate 5-kinase